MGSSSLCWSSEFACTGRGEIQTDSQPSNAWWSLGGSHMHLSEVSLSELIRAMHAWCVTLLSSTFPDGSTLSSSSFGFLSCWELASILNQAGYATPNLSNTWSGSRTSTYVSLFLPKTSSWSISIAFGSLFTSRLILTVESYSLESGKSRKLQLNLKLKSSSDFKFDFSK